MSHSRPLASPQPSAHLMSGTGAGLANWGACTDTDEHYDEVVRTGGVGGRADPDRRRGICCLGPGDNGVPRACRIVLLRRCELIAEPRWMNQAMCRRESMILYKNAQGVVAVFTRIRFLKTSSWMP